MGDGEVIAVKVLRFRIACFMVFVAVAALDFTAIRAVFDHKGPTSYLLGIGAMPMANVLAVGLLVGDWRRAGHRFLMGFEAFGTMALAAYVVSASLFAKELVIPYLQAVHSPLVSYIDVLTRVLPQSYFVIYYLILAVLLGLPLLAFARGLLLPRARNGRTARPGPLLMGQQEPVPVFCSLATHGTGTGLSEGVVADDFTPIPRGNPLVDAERSGIAVQQRIAPRTSSRPAGRTPGRSARN